MGLRVLVGAERAVVVEVVEHGGQADAEHLPADVAQQLAP